MTIIQTFQYCIFYGFYPTLLYLLMLSVFCPLFRSPHERGDGNWITTSKCSIFPFTKFSNLPPKIFDFHTIQFLVVFGNNSNHWPVVQTYPKNYKGRTLFQFIEKQIFFINNQSVKSTTAIMWHCPTEKPKIVVLFSFQVYFTSFYPIYNLIILRCASITIISF